MCVRCQLGGPGLGLTENAPTGRRHLHALWIWPDFGSSYTRMLFSRGIWSSECAHKKPRLTLENHYPQPPHLYFYLRPKDRTLLESIDLQFMAIVPLTSLSQFNTVVSSQHSSADPRVLSLPLSHLSSCCTDQRQPCLRHLLLGVLVWSMSRHDADLQWCRGLGLACGCRLLQSGHRPCERHRPASRRANSEQLSVPNPRVPLRGVHTAYCII